MRATNFMIGWNRIVSAAPLPPRPKHACAAAPDFFLVASNLLGTLRTHQRRPAVEGSFTRYPRQSLEYRKAQKRGVPNILASLVHDLL
jgi:hypothetical protein